MKTSFLILLLLVITFGVYSQNLVPNSSFETYTSCPVGPSQTNLAPPWIQPTDSGTSDYFNVCNQSVFPIPFPIPGFGTPVGVPSNLLGWQQPRTGNAYCGFYALDGLNIATVSDYREYVQAQLTQPLVVGTTYLVKFYVSLCNTAVIASDGIGAYLSTTAIHQADGVFPYIPQITTTSVISDTAGWTLVQGTITPTEPYTYITIGNFKTNAQTTMEPFVGESFAGGSFPGGGPGFGIGGSYYFIDDVSVEPNGPMSITGENVICAGDSVLLTVSGASTYQWEADPSLSCLTCNQVWVSPTATTTYTVHGDGVYTTFFTVTVSNQNFATATASQNTLTASAGGTTYQWYLNDSPISGATNQVYIITESGTYYCIVTFPGGCTANTGTMELTYKPNSIAELGMISFDVFPNPSSTELNIQFSTASKTNVDVMIYDILGQKVFEIPSKGVVGENKTIINTSSLPKGVYRLTLITEAGFTSLPIIKE